MSQGEKMVWVDWVIIAFEQERGNIKNLKNDRLRMSKYGISTKKQI
jgi:hypothetical protein